MSERASDRCDRKRVRDDKDKRSILLIQSETGLLLTALVVFVKGSLVNFMNMNLLPECHKKGFALHGEMSRRDQRYRSQLRGRK